MYQAAADFDYRDTEWVKPTQPEQNPSRRSYWTKLAFDPTPQIWMLSAVAPLYRRGVWYGSVGHDLPLAKLVERTALLRQYEGSQFILVNIDGRVVASDHFADAIKSAKGELKIGDLPDPQWANILNAAHDQGIENQQHVRVEMSEQNQVAFVSRIRGQDWLLINRLPLAQITSQIESSFVNLRNIAVVSLLLELVIATSILWWNHYRSREFFAHLHRIQHQLRTSEEHYRTLVANIPGIVFSCDLDSHWTMKFISSAVFDLTGYPSSDFIGNSVRSFDSIVHPDDKPRIDDVLAEAFKEQRPYAVEYRIFCHDGSMRWLYEHGRRISNEKGEYVLEGVILDATALKKAEMTLHELNATLEHQVEERTRELKVAIRELETFNYAVSHDLRAPLRHVGSYLEMIKDELGDHASQALISRCQAALQRMNEMIGAMLSLAQLGQESLALKPLDLNSLVAEVVANQRVGGGSRAHFDIGLLPTVMGDRVLMRQVVQNLIDNAVKYSAKSEMPLITIHDCTPSMETNEYVLEFRDNGVGFDAQYADRLFHLFHRLHRLDEFPGSGVGLALCSKIIILHKGRIWAHGEVGRGASFFIALPRQTIG